MFIYFTTFQGKKVILLKSINRLFAEMGKQHVYFEIVIEVFNFYI